MKIKNLLLTLALVAGVSCVGVSLIEQANNNDISTTNQVVQEKTTKTVASVDNHVKLTNSWLQGLPITHSEIKEIIFTNDKSDLKLNDITVDWDTPKGTSGNVSAFIGTKGTDNVLVVHNEGGTIGVISGNGFFGTSNTVITNIQYRSVTKIDFNDVFVSDDLTTDYRYMFSNLTSLETISGLENYDFSSATDISYMFQGVDISSVDLSSMDVTNVTKMTGTFKLAQSTTNIDLTSWNVSNVTDFSSMFSTVASNVSINLDGWDIVSATNLNSMFESAKFTEIKVGWTNVSNVETFNKTFYDCDLITKLDLSTWVTTSAIDMRYMLYRLENLTELNVSNFDTSKVTDFYFMMEKLANTAATPITLDLSSFTIKSGAIATGLLSGVNTNCIITPKLIEGSIEVGLSGDWAEKPYDFDHVIYETLTSTTPTNVSIYPALPLAKLAAIEDLREERDRLLSVNGYEDDKRLELEQVYNNYVDYINGRGSIDGVIDYLGRGISALGRVEHLISYTYVLNNGNENIVRWNSKGPIVAPDFTVTRDGYNFDAWCSDPELTNEVNFGMTMEINGSVTFYAKWDPIKYEVTLEFNSDKASTKIDVYSGELIEFPTEVGSVVGHHFIGWSTDDTEGNIIDPSTYLYDLASDSIFYAIWAPNTFTVVYNATEGAGLMSNQTIQYGSGTKLTLNSFSRVGYKFAGWSLFLDGSGTIYADNTDGSTLTEINGETITLYATWTAISYTIEFNSNGGTGNMEDLEMTFGTPANLTLNTFTKIGYYFSGWTIPASGNDTVYDDGQLVNNLTQFDGNRVVFYAKWTAISYQIVYEKNDGSGITTSQTVNYDEALSLTLNQFTRTGYIFKGWNTTDSGTEPDYTDGQSVDHFTTTNNDTITLYAVWEAITYQVQFNGNDATSGSLSNQTMTYDTSVNLTSNTFTKVGYTFVGWNTDIAGNGTDYEDGQSVDNLTTTNGDTVILYAIWGAITYIVDFHENTGSGSMDDQTMTYDTSVDLTLNAFTKTGYTFLKWNTQADGNGTDYTDGVSVSNLTTTADATVILYAIWSPITYKVEFDSNTGSGTMIGITMTYDVLTTLSMNTFTKDGYIFVGWNTQADGNGTDYTDGVSVSNLTTTNGDTVILYAIWAISKHTVTFMDGTTVLFKVEDLANGEKVTRPATDPTKTGYAFAGWVTTNDGSELFNFDSAITGDISIFASWTINTYSEEFINDSGSTLASNNSLTHGSTYTVTVTLSTLFTLDSIVIKMGDKTLVAGIDYTVSGNVYTLTITGNIVVETKTTNLRDAAKEELEDYYEDLKDKNPDLTDDQLQDLEDALNDALDKVENAGSKDELDEEVETGKVEMDKVIIDKELEDYYDDLIDKNPGLTEDQLEDLEDELNDAKDEVSNSTTTDDANDASTTGKDNMDKIVSGIVNYWSILPLIATICLMALLIFLASKVKRRED